MTSVGVKSVVGGCWCEVGWCEVVGGKSLVGGRLVRGRWCEACWCEVGGVKWVV